MKLSCDKLRKKWARLVKEDSVLACFAAALTSLVVLGLVGTIVFIAVMVRLSRSINL